MKLRSLYDKYGEDRLRDILRDFYRRMSQDVLIGYFFFNKDIQQIADRQFDFMRVAMGVNQNYKGKTPTHAHLELPPILSGHFDRRIVLLRETLVAFGLSAEEIQIWTDFENAFREVIVSPENKR